MKLLLMILRRLLFIITTGVMSHAMKINLTPIISAWEPTHSRKMPELFVNNMKRVFIGIYGEGFYFYLSGKPLVVSASFF
jgi:hypothetical protein